jgi:DNA-directed RNA polymerase subunit RPC12/RpoP
MQSFREPTGADRGAGIRVLVLYLAIVLAASVIIVWLPGTAGFVLWMAIVLFATVMLARWNARHAGYRCAHCGHEFQISTLTELVSPHGRGGGGWKYLRCPRCDRKSRSKTLAKQD